MKIKRIALKAGPGKIDFVLISFATLLYILFPVSGMATGLADSGLYVIPYPQKVVIGGDDFSFNNSVNIVLDKNHSPADEFTANELIRDLKSEWNIEGIMVTKKVGNAIVLTRRKNTV